MCYSGKPKISVVTVCYNAVDTIEKTILSVINQTYEKVEYIIIDGASKDGTIDIIHKSMGKIHVFVSEPDKGIYDAMNKGIKIATGDYILFMNAGDAFVNNNILEYICKNYNFDKDIIYGSINKCLKDCYYVYRPYPIEEMKWHMILPHQATFVKTAYHKKHLFDVSFKSSGDYNFFYEAYYKYHASFKEINSVIADYKDDTGMSKDNFKKARIEDLRIWGKDKNLMTVFNLYLWFLFRDSKNILKKLLPVKLKTKLRNYQLQKQGFILLDYDRQS